MRKTIGLMLAAALAAGGLAARADAPTGPGAGPCGGGHRGWGARHYDPKAMTTVTGKVAEVETFGRGGRGGGVRLDLETAEGTLPVHVGPRWFLEEQGLTLAKGDALEITGSKVAFDGKPLVIAQVVKKGGTAVALRDVQGIPVWAGCGRR